MATLYGQTEDGGMRFTSSRRAGEVRIPNYVYDMWPQLLGATAIHVYAIYCRLEREGVVKGMTMARIARHSRIGTGSLHKINEKLVECGFVKITKPTGHKRLMHWTTEIEVLDPPREVPSELIEKYGHGDRGRDYELLCPWLGDPEIPVGFSENTSGVVDEIPVGSSNVESLGLNPLGVVVGAETTTPTAGERPKPAPVRETTRPITNPKAKAKIESEIDFVRYPYAEPGVTVIRDGFVEFVLDLDDAGERVCPSCGADMHIMAMKESRAACGNVECGMGIRARYVDERAWRWRPPQKMRQRAGRPQIPFREAVRAFCELAGMDFDRLGATTAAQYGAKLQEIANEADVTERDTVAAIESIVSKTANWPTSPFQFSFRDELAAQIARLGDTGGSVTSRVPDWLREKYLQEAINAKKRREQPTN